MNKYYVQSGTVRYQVKAESARKAAIWAVHQVMQQIVPIDSGDRPSVDTRKGRLNRDDVAVLSSRVVVSERGYDQPDGSQINTLEIVSEWNQMLMALDRLQKILDRAA